MLCSELRNAGLDELLVRPHQHPGQFLHQLLLPGHLGLVEAGLCLGVRRGQPGGSRGGTWGGRLNRGGNVLPGSHGGGGGTDSSRDIEVRPGEKNSEFYIWSREQFYPDWMLEAGGGGRSEGRGCWSCCWAGWSWWEAGADRWRRWTSGPACWSPAPGGSPGGSAWPAESRRGPNRELRLQSKHSVWQNYPSLVLILL